VKHLHLVTLLCVLLAFIGDAAVAGEISFGFKAGMIMSNITETPREWDDAKSYKAGFTGGVFLNYAFDEHFSIEPELLYTMKGFKGSLYDGFVSVDLTACFDYFEMPVLATYSFMAHDRFRPRVFAGPMFAYNFGSELEVSVGPLGASVDLSSLTHVTDFGIVAGAGFDYSIGQGMLTFDVRYQRAFTNVIMSGDFEINGSTQTISEDDFKNYGFAVMVGYGF